MGIRLEAIEVGAADASGRYTPHPAPRAGAGNLLGSDKNTVITMEPKPHIAMSMYVGLGIGKRFPRQPHADPLRLGDGLANGRRPILEASREGDQGRRASEGQRGAAGGRAAANGCLCV